MNRITFQGSTQKDLNDLERVIATLQLITIVKTSRGTSDGILRVSKNKGSILIEADEGCRLEEFSCRAEIGDVRKEKGPNGLIATFHYEGMEYVIRFGESRFNVPRSAYSKSEDRVPF